MEVAVELGGGKLAEFLGDKRGTYQVALGAVTEDFLLYLSG